MFLSVFIVFKQNCLPNFYLSQYKKFENENFVNSPTFQQIFPFSENVKMNFRANPKSAPLNVK